MAAGKRKRAISPRICVSAGSNKKRSKKPENTSRPESKPRRSWKRETSFRDGMRRLHDGYEKARYSREGCTKEEAEALRN